MKDIHCQATGAEYSFPLHAVTGILLRLKLHTTILFRHLLRYYYHNYYWQCRQLLTLFAVRFQRSLVHGGNRRPVCYFDVLSSEQSSVKLIGSFVGILSPVNHKGLHQG